MNSERDVSGSGFLRMLVAAVGTGLLTCWQGTLLYELHSIRPEVLERLALHVHVMQCRAQPLFTAHG